MRSLRSNGAQMKAKIYITGLHVLKASSSARIRPMTPLTGNSAELGISSSGRIENLKLNATGRVRLALSSSGRLTNAAIAAQRSRLYAEQQLIRLAHTPRQERHFRPEQQFADRHQRRSGQREHNRQQFSVFPRCRVQHRQRDAGQLLFVADYRRCRSGSQSHRKQLFG